MTAPELADCWTPVPLRWRHAIEGDVFVGRDGALWRVDQANSFGPAGIEVVVSCAAATHAADVDPDEVVHVLVPVTERDAVELTREQLGARLVDRRTA